LAIGKPPCYPSIGRFEKSFPKIGRNEQKKRKIITQRLILRGSSRELITGAHHGSSSQGLITGAHHRGSSQGLITGDRKSGWPFELKEKVNFKKPKIITPKIITQTPENGPENGGLKMGLKILRRTLENDR
jgi:hypothetical protein